MSFHSLISAIIIILYFILVGSFPAKVCFLPDPTNPTQTPFPTQFLSDAKRDGTQS
ncbi:hypothetical protein BDW68DRAFT_66716 [Aspergillus falconensis]